MKPLSPPQALLFGGTLRVCLWEGFSDTVIENTVKPRDGFSEAVLEDTVKPRDG